VSTQELLDFIARHDHWVYALLFGYCLAKTGPLPMVAGYVSAAGALDAALAWPLVLAGSAIGAQLRFVVGHAAAPWLYRKSSRVGPWVALGAAAVERYGSALLPLYRFSKGSYTLVNLGAGASTLHWARYSGLDLAGALLWSVASVGTGLIIGQIGAAFDPRWAAYVGLALLATAIVATALFGRRLKAALLPLAQRVLAERMGHASLAAGRAAP
jgi:membrane protein DedA with SNARE-associated domain